jgi:soluble lytic murein transglycosylase-like protein
VSLSTVSVPSRLQIIQERIQQLETRLSDLAPSELSDLPELRPLDGGPGSELRGLAMAGGKSFDQVMQAVQRQASALSNSAQPVDAGMNTGLTLLPSLPLPKGDFGPAMEAKAALQRAAYYNRLKGEEAPVKAAPGPKKQLVKMAHKIAEEYQLNPQVFKALIHAESGFRTGARSSAGAIGLTQLMPRTAKALGVKNPWDPVQNMIGGAKYLKSLMNRFQGSTELALAAYNAGPNAVKRHGNKIPPYRETRAYVNKILTMSRKMDNV